VLKFADTRRQRRLQNIRALGRSGETHPTSDNDEDIPLANFRAQN
jgi:hypothetical protein